MRQGSGQGRLPRPVGPPLQVPSALVGSMSTGTGSGGVQPPVVNSGHMAVTGRENSLKRGCRWSGTSGSRALFFDTPSGDRTLFGPGADNGTVEHNFGGE